MLKKVVDWHDIHSHDEESKNRYTIDMKLFLALLLVVFGLVAVFFRVNAAMTSTNYTISWDNLNSGGSDVATSASYTMYDTIGQPMAGYGTSTNYSIEAGYRVISDTELALVTRGQSTGVEVAYTNLSIPAASVLVTSAAAFSVGDYIAVVENKGFDQLVSMGRITSILGTLITVDGWQGEQALMTPSVTGGDDFVYLLGSATTIPFGTIETGEEKVALAGVSVFSSATSGHTVYIQGADELGNSGGDALEEVLDGVVSTDAEEYGAEAIGPHAVSPSVDLGVTTTQRMVLLNTVPAIGDPDRLLLLFKLSVSNATVDDDYSQEVYITLTANF